MLLLLCLCHQLHRELDRLVYRQIHPLFQRPLRRRRSVLADFEIYKENPLVHRVLVVNHLNLNHLSLEHLNLEHLLELVHLVAMSVEFLLQNLVVLNRDEHLPSVVVVLV
jgi:hypothetical protein